MYVYIFFIHSYTTQSNDVLTSTNELLPGEQSGLKWVNENFIKWDLFLQLFNNTIPESYDENGFPYE